MRHACFIGIAMLLVACTPVGTAPTNASLEDIYVLRSIREPATPGVDACAMAKTGFEPLPGDAARAFSFWSVASDIADGRLIDVHAKRVARLQACMGATPERARQNFYADIELGGLTFQGRGECQALLLDRPEPKLYPVRCQLVLSGLPPPYVGGLLTTNTLTTAAAFGGDTDPPGYTQASIATIRLWRARAAR